MSLRKFPSTYKYTLFQNESTSYRFISDFNYKLKSRIYFGTMNTFEFVSATMSRAKLSLHCSVFKRTSKTGRVMSCPPSVRPSTDTVQDIFMKLSTNINHHQAMCREQEPTLHLHLLRNYGPLNFFL